MKYIASLLFAIVFCLVVLTEVANCAPEANAHANPLGREGGGFRGGFGREGGFGQAFEGIGREGGWR
jgi:hypothetical protein